MATLTALVRGRLSEEVPALGGRLLSAVDFASLLARGQPPQVTPAAAVLPLGMRGGRIVATFGQYAQSVARVVGIATFLRAPEPATARAADELEETAEAITACLVGWTPDDRTPGVFRLEEGKLVSMAGGLLRYDHTFVLDDAVEEP